MAKSTNYWHLDIHSLQNRGPVKNKCKTLIGFEHLKTNLLNKKFAVYQKSNQKAKISIEDVQFLD
jgi:hypothetical protein